MNFLINQYQFKLKIKIFNLQKLNQYIYFIKEFTFQVISKLEKHLIQKFVHKKFFIKKTNSNFFIKKMMIWKFGKKKFKIKSKIKKIFIYHLKYIIKFFQIKKSNLILINMILFVLDFVFWNQLEILIFSSFIRKNLMKNYQNNISMN